MKAIVEDIRRGLHELGYTDQLIQSLVRVGGPHGPRLDLVAYSSPDIKDISTTAIAGHVVNGEGDRAVPTVLDLARRVAAPGALIGLGSRVKLFSVAATHASDRLITEFGKDEQSEILRKFKGDLGPRSLSRAKRTARQLALFPIDVRLLATARENSADQLSDLVEESVSAIQSYERGTAARSVGTLVAAVALLVVRDRYELEGSTSHQIVDAALRHDPTFSWLREVIVGRPAIDPAINILAGAANFGWLDGAAISRLYENLLVTETARKTFAIHYTPQELAERIASAIPFEAIPPEERSLLDPTCGSGSLLAAGHSRLADLAPPTGPGSVAHELLKASIRGWDIDEVAAEIARLTLVVQSLPYGNHWAIDERDALTRSGPQDQARVVISNPPWMVKRGTRQDIAELFLRKMQSLVEAGGFLACVLPAAWLLREKSSASREELRKAFDVIEVWRLPRDVFAEARHASCVVIAEKKSQTKRNHYVYRQIAPGRERIRTFLRTGEAAFHRVGPQGDPSGTLVITPFDGLPHFHDLPTLGDEARVISGVVQRSDISESRSGIPILRRGVDLPLGRLVPQDAVGYVESVKHFAHGHRNVEPFENKKVLLQALRFPDNGWRSRPLLDEVGLLTSETWNGVYPTSGNTPRVRAALVALFMSTFASAWFYTNVATRRLHVRTIKGFPLPPDGLSHLADALSDLGQEWLINSDSSVLRKVDASVARLYKLPQGVQLGLERLLGNQVAPEGGIRYEVERSASELAIPDPTIQRPGTVLKIKNSTLWIWTPEGPDEGVPVDVPARIPGWLCEEGATFQVVGKDLSTADYMFQRATHISDEQLFGVVNGG